MTEPVTFIILFALRVVAMVFLLRFILQAVQASFYNPFSQGIARITDPVLNPMRTVLRRYRNLDIASFVAAWTVHTLAAAAYVVSKDLPIDYLFIINDGLRESLHLVVGIFLVAILASIVLSWIAPGVHSPAADIARSVAEPLLAPARRLLPPLGGLDLSPMITIALLLLIQSFVLPAVLPYRLWPG